MVLSGFPQFSAVLLGKEGVGKSSLIVRFNEHDIFDPVREFPNKPKCYYYNMKASLDTEFVDPYIPILEERRFEKIVTTANGYFLIFDIHDRSSFDAISHLRERVFGIINRNNMVRNKTLFVIGNKADVHGNREVTTEEAEMFARKIGARYYEVSAHNNLNVDQMFREMVTTMRLSKADELD